MSYLWGEKPKLVLARLTVFGGEDSSEDSDKGLLAGEGRRGPSGGWDTEGVSTVGGEVGVVVRSGGVGFAVDSLRQVAGRLGLAVLCI